MFETHKGLCKTKYTLNSQFEHKIQSVEMVEYLIRTEENHQSRNGVLHCENAKRTEYNGYRLCKCNCVLTQLLLEVETVTEEKKQNISLIVLIRCKSNLNLKKFRMITIIFCCRNSCRIYRIISKLMLFIELQFFV